MFNVNHCRLILTRNLCINRSKKFSLERKEKFGVLPSDHTKSINNSDYKSSGTGSRQKLYQKEFGMDDYTKSFST